VILVGFELNVVIYGNSRKHNAIADWFLFLGDFQHG
jgi:hypothetical protein